MKHGWSFRWPGLPGLSADAGLQRAASVGPAKRFGQRLVEIVDEVNDALSQGCQRWKISTLQDAPYQDAEPDLDLVQPRRVLRRVDEAKAMLQVREKRLAAGHRFQHSGLPLFTERLLRDAALRRHETHQA